MKNIIRWTLMGVCLAFNMASQAQEALSLSEAIRLGLEKNYDIRIQEQQTEIAANNNSWGEAGLYPNLNFILGQSNSITDNVKTASPFQAQGPSVNNSITPEVELNWTLFNGFKVRITKKKLAELESESSGNADIVISNTIQAIILGYYNAVLEYERMLVFEESKKLSSDKYRYLELKKTYGAAVTSDLLLEEGNYLTDSVNYINQELKYRDALRKLNLLLAAEETDPSYKLTDALDLKVEQYDYQALEQKMTKENVDLQKQYISQSILKSERKTRQAERMPTLGFTVRGSSNNSRVDFSRATFPNTNGSNQFAEPLTSVTNQYSAGFRLTFNLFNGGKINRAIENAYIQEDIANIQVNQLKASLKRDLSAAFDNFQVKKQLYNINVRRLDAAVLNLRLSEEKFKNGTINSFDYRTIQNTRQLAAVQELQSRFDLIEADLNLLRLSGGILEVYK